MKTMQTPGLEEPSALEAAQPSAVEEAVVGMVPALAGALAGTAALAIVGAVLGWQGGGLAALSEALLGQHSAWYLSRASAFISYLLLWWSMILGLSITNRLACIWPGGPVATDLHEHASLLGLAFGALHGLVLVADQYIGYTLPQILIPFAGTYEPLWVGLGQVGIYLMALVTLSFYVRRQIGARAWRLIHFLSFAVFGLSLLHGLYSGSDSGTWWAWWMYLVTGATVLWQTIYRVMERGGPAKAAQAA